MFGASKSEVAEGPINTRELNIRLHRLLSRAENHKEFVTYGRYRQENRAML